MLVNDFMSVDYNQVTALNTSAIQELYKLIQQQNTIIQDLQNRIKILENQNL
jgi:2-keto-3-deoxy-galactonokinase